MINTQLQALLAVTLIVGAISGGITWIAGRVAESKLDKALDKFKAELVQTLDDKYATKAELEGLKDFCGEIKRRIRILEQAEREGG